MMDNRRSGGLIVVRLLAVMGALVGAHAMGGPPNDNCTQAEFITGEGMFAFDNAAATTDGPGHEACSFGFGSEIVSDVWYCWTAACSGLVTVDTCQGTTVDTKLAVYDGCDCPATDVNLLSCNDDVCVYQSGTTFEAVAGQDYLIRIGVHPDLGGGSGVFTVTCGEPMEPPCSHSSETCENRDSWNAYNSNRTDFVAADDFTPESDGLIAGLCWWGTYFDGIGECRIVGPDTFEVRYYADEDGLPGALLAGPFSQADGTLTVTGPARTGGLIMDFLREYEYAATHDPVQVLAGECYWIEISNLGANTCSWFWEAAGPGSRWALQTAALEPPDYDAADAIPDDLAFCLDIVRGDSTPCLMPPINDDCVDSLPIFDGETSFDTTGATTDGPDEPVCEFTFADPEVNQDIWFDYVAPPPCNGIVTVTLCDSLYDTKMAVYEGSECPPAGDPIACNDDGCTGDFPLESQLTFPVEIGLSYKLRVGGYGDSAGLGTIWIALDLPDCNDNGVPDECDILGGTSIDCDYNDIPDECETDCNDNGILDECDLADGSSTDDNGNGIPDECECLLSELAKLTGSDLAGIGLFGSSVAIDADVALIGARFDTDGKSPSGSAYVYRFDGGSWTEEAKLTASDGDWGRLFGFGTSVALSGKVAVIGAPGDDDAGFGSGSAYVYRYDGTAWGDEVKLTASDAAERDWFGTSVSIDGDVAVIGAPQPWYDGGTGSAYVYRFDGANWIEQAKLTPYIGVNGGQFGRSVSLSGDVALIGAAHHPYDPTRGGAAYVFRFDGSSWFQQDTLAGSDSAYGDWFGASVFVSGDVALVGAPGPEYDSNVTGAAYVYRFDGSSWIEETKLVPADAEEGDRFGVSVSLSGDLAVIGAADDEDDGIASGSAYVYRFDGANWIEQAKLIASDASDGDWFGRGVSASGDVALIGAPWDHDAGSTSGSAYVFGGLSSDCNDNGIFDACEPGDFDGDGHIDLVDFAQWEACVTGPEIGPVAGCCALFDFDEDQDVDHRDFAAFQTAFTGQ